MQNHNSIFIYMFSWEINKKHDDNDGSRNSLSGPRCSSNEDDISNSDDNQGDNNDNYQSVC